MVEPLFISHFDKQYILLVTKSGVSFEFQCGGCACVPMSREGILIPTTFETKALDQILYGRMPYGQPLITPDEADRLDEILRTEIDENIGTAWTVDRMLFHECMEAWLPIRIDGHPLATHAILVWENSD